MTTSDRDADAGVRRRRRARHVPQRAGERAPGRPAQVGLRPPAVAGATTARGRWSAGACSRSCSLRRSSSVGGQPLVLLNVLERRFVLLRPRLLAAGLLSRRARRADRPRHAGALDRGRRPRLVRLAVPADGLHGDGVPEDRVPDRRLGRAAGAARPGAVDRRDRAWRRVVKHAIFFALSFAIANVFLAYIIGSARSGDDRHRPAARAPRRPDRDHDLQPAVLRRLRAVPRAGLHAGLSVRPRHVVADRSADDHRDLRHRRAASRAAVWRAPPTARGAARGDCVDCEQCVTVCPTGIDIRNGIQLECVNCTACMDACDDVMSGCSGRPD